MGGETPGIGGVTGVAQGKTRVTTAWRNVVVAMNRTVPAQLARSQAVRRRTGRRK